MSYLRNFKGVPNQTDPSAGSVVASSISDPDLEAKFTHLRLNGMSAQAVINSISGHVQALNLSHNRIEQLPRSLPVKVVGLNLSFNLLSNLRGSRALSNLIELNVSNNSLTSLLDLSYCVGLQYLDISSNQLTEIVGLEGLSNLKMLKCNGNLIQNNSGFRTLSFNTQLVSLDVAQNPVSEANYQDVRVYIHNLLPSLKTLDGNSIRTNQIGYLENVQPLMKRNSPTNAVDLQAGSAPGQMPISAMSSPTWSAGFSLPRTPAGQQQQQQPDVSQSYFDHFSTQSKQAMPLQSPFQRAFHQETQKVESNIQVVPRDDTMYYEQQQQQEIDEAYDELMENRYVSNSRLPWRNPPNPLPREYASRPWLTDSITSNKREEYDRTKSPINYFLQLRQRSDAQDVSSVAPANSVGGQSMGAMSKKELDVRSEKSVHQHYDLNVSNLSVCHADSHLQHNSTQLPLLPTEISLLQLDGRTCFATPTDVAQVSSNNSTIPQASITSGANASTLLAKTQQSFRYSNPKAAPVLRSYTKAYQKTVETFEKNRSKNPKLLPHQQPYDGVYPSPVSTPLHNQYPGFYTLRGNEDDAEMYAGLEDDINANPQMQLNFGGPEVSPLSGPQGQPHPFTSTSSAPTLAWMAPSLRSPPTTTGVSTKASLSLPVGPGSDDAEGQGNVPVWDILEVAKRWDIRPRGIEYSASEQRRGRSRSPHPTHFTPDSLLHQSHHRSSHSQTRSYSPTKASVLRAEYIKTQQFEQEHKKQLEEAPLQRPRFMDTYVPTMAAADETKIFTESLRDSKEGGERGRGPIISRSRIRRSNLENLVSPAVGSTNRSRSASSRPASELRSKRPPSRSKSPYQNLMDLKSRIRSLLNNEAEYFEAKRHENHQHHQQQQQLQQHLHSKHESRVFDFMRGDMTASAEGYTTSGTRSNETAATDDPVNSSLQTIRSNRSNISASNSLIMMPTVASRNMLRHPENVVKTSTALTQETKAKLANPPVQPASDRLKTGSLRAKVPMRPPGSAPVSTKTVNKTIKGNPAVYGKRSVSPAALARSKPASKETIAHSHSHIREEEKTKRIDEEMVFLKRMNECLQLFESAAANLSDPQQQSSNAANNTVSMEQMMGAGFVLYEQLVRKRAQLMNDMQLSSPTRYGTDPAAMPVSTSSPTDHRRSGRLARESEHVLRALQRYMLDILEREEKLGHRQSLDPQLLMKVRSLTPNKYTHRPFVHQHSEEYTSYYGHSSATAAASSKIESDKQMLAEELKSISQVINGLKAQYHRRGDSLSPPAPVSSQEIAKTDARKGAETSSPVTQAVISPRPSKIPVSLQRTNSSRTIFSATTQATFSTNNTSFYAATNALAGRPIAAILESRTKETVEEGEDEDGIVVDAHGRVVSSLPRTASTMNANNSRQDVRHLATTSQPNTASESFSSNAVEPSVTDIPLQKSSRMPQQTSHEGTSFLSPIAETVGVSFNNSQLNQASHFTFDQSAISQASTPAAMDQQIPAGSNASMSMQAMAIGSLIAQLTARQKESLIHLQQQRAQPISSPSNSVNSVYTNSTPVPYNFGQAF
jgi:hypothetical protein